MVRVSAMLPTVALVLILGSLVPAHLSRTAGFFVLGLWAGNRIWSMFRCKGKKILFL